MVCNAVYKLTVEQVWVPQSKWKGNAAETLSLSEKKDLCVYMKNFQSFLWQKVNGPGFALGWTLLGTHKVEKN